MDIFSSLKSGSDHLSDDSRIAITTAEQDSAYQTNLTKQKNLKNLTFEINGKVVDTIR